MNGLNGKGELPPIPPDAPILRPNRGYRCDACGETLPVGPGEDPTATLREHQVRRHPGAYHLSFTPLWRVTVPCQVCGQRVDLDVPPGRGPDWCPAFFSHDGCPGRRP